MSSASIQPEVGRDEPELLRASYQAISLYSPNRAPCEVDLSDNTNLWGIPPSVRRLLESAAGPLVTRYPQAYADDLKRAIADYVSLPADCVVTGCGSDDVLDSAIRAFTEPGQTLAQPDPSFAMVEKFARMNGLRPRAIPLTGGYDADTASFIGTGAAVTYLCSPNNPTATTLSRRAIETIVARAPGVVILDEAYAEFADSHCMDLVAESKRLIITRTFSKAFGLAGLRIGYAVAPARLAREIEKSRGPYKVSGLGARAAIAALTDDRQWVDERIMEARAARAELTRELRRRGLSPLSSQANFVLAPVARAAAVCAGLRERGVAVRPFPELTGIGDAIRITVGPRQMMERFLTALDEVLQCE